MKSPGDAKRGPRKSVISSRPASHPDGSHPKLLQAERANCEGWSVMAKRAAAPKAILRRPRQGNTAERRTYTWQASGSSSCCQHAQPAADKAVVELASQLESDLLRLHGPIMGGAALHAALGYPSASAFRMALARDRVPVKIFSIDHRRGKFALVKDVAVWLAQQRLGESPIPSARQQRSNAMVT